MKTTGHTDYYQLLGLEYDCTRQEIKHAFRHRAKRLHPDTAHSGQGAGVSMYQLLLAYRTLSNPDRRRTYDRIAGLSSRQSGFDYRAWLLEKTDDLVSQSKLILFDLLHDNPDSALAIYDRYFRYGRNDMVIYLGQRDFMDCAFLLAEEYQARGALLQSFRLQMNIAYLERQKPYFRHFFVEVIDNIRSLICSQMNGSVSEPVILDCLDEVIGYNFSPRITAGFCLAAAELCFKRHDDQRGVRYLQRFAIGAGEKRMRARA